MGCWPIGQLFLLFLLLEAQGALLVFVNAGHGSHLARRGVIVVHHAVVTEEFHHEVLEVCAGALHEHAVVEDVHVAGNDRNLHVATVLPDLALDMQAIRNFGDLQVLKALGNLIAEIGPCGGLAFVAEVEPRGKILGVLAERGFDGLVQADKVAIADEGEFFLENGEVIGGFRPVVNGKSRNKRRKAHGQCKKEGGCFFHKLKVNKICYIFKATHCCPGGGMVDTGDLKSLGGNLVRVQVPPRALKTKVFRKISSKT